MSHSGFCRLVRSTASASESESESVSEPQRIGNTVCSLLLLAARRDLTQKYSGTLFCTSPGPSTRRGPVEPRGNWGQGYGQEPSAPKNTREIFNFSRAQDQHWGVQRAWLGLYATKMEMWQICNLCILLVPCIDHPRIRRS